MRKKTLLFICAFLVTLITYAQTITVRGKVYDDKGVAVPGANIASKKSKKVLMAAGNDGSFTVNIPAGEVLTISALGYISQDVTAADNVTISLKSDVNTLADIVVTGVGVATSKRRLGIAVQSVTADKLPQTPTASIDQALVGKVPGAQISSVSGNPGDPVNIVLRGINSLGGTQPIFLVDGVQVKGVDVNSLDLSNIERVEIVQGAASASLFGAQGANGVVQIFTKKGKQGVPQIAFSSSYSSNKFLNIGDVHKSRLHPYLTGTGDSVLDAATLQPVVLNDDGTLPKISYRYGAPELGYPAAARLAILGPQNINNTPYDANLKYYDHFDQIFQTGYTLNNTLSISGAGNKSDYNFALANNTTETPILKSGKVNRTNLSLNLGTEVLKNLRLRSTTQVIYTKNTLTPYLGAPGSIGYGTGNNTDVYNYGGSSSGVYGFLNTSPFFDQNYVLPSDSVSPVNYQNANFLSVNTGNPVYTKHYSNGLDNKIEVVQGLDVNYQPSHWIELDGKYGINYRNENARWTFFNQSDNLSTSNYDTYAGVYAADPTGEIINYQYTNTYQNLLTSATIRTDFQNDFHLKIPIRTSTLIAYDYRKNYYKEYDTYGTGLPMQPPINISATSSQAVSFDYIEPFTTYGYLLDQKIDIGEWGGVTGGFRTDYSSNFGTNRKFTFPHANGYLSISSFDFWKNGSIGKAISYFKIRSAYGEAGIQPGFGDRYPGIDQSNVGEQLGYSIQSPSKNSEVGVERTKEFEIGTDFSLSTGSKSWFNSITGSFTYWNRKSSDVITDISLPPSSGLTGIRDNTVNLSSKGVEAQLNLGIFKSKNFNWDFTTNFGHSKSVIDKINGTIQQFTGAAGSVQLKLIEGQPIGQIFGYKALTSINQLREDKTPFIPVEDQSKYEIVDGRVVDTASKAIYFSDEAAFIGDPNPKFNMSFINSISFRDIVTLNFQFDWVYGSHLYNQTKEWMYRDGISGDFDDAVTINGKTAAYTAYHASAYYGLGDAAFGPGNNATKDYFYENASFVRLRNVSLGIDIGKLANISAFKRLQLVLTGRNIWTSTKYTGFDPELNSGPANSSFERGIDHSSLPNIKSYQVGLNIGL